jgi:HSP90 family molecular chaperone
MKTTKAAANITNKLGEELKKKMEETEQVNLLNKQFGEKLKAGIKDGYASAKNTEFQRIKEEM